MSVRKIDLFFVLIFCCLSCCLIQRTDSASDVDTLIATQVIFRHGARNIDRTFPTDPYKDETLWPPGFFQLNCLGQTQGYNLGRFLFSQYPGLLKDEYDPKDIFVLSSDVNRCIQTAQSVLAGLYPPNDPVEQNSTQCEEIVWKSLPIHTIPAAYDNIIRQDAPCPRYEWLLQDVLANTKEIADEVQNLKIGDTPLIDYVSENTGVKINSLSELFLYTDTLAIEKYYNLTMDAWVEPVLAKLSKLGQIYFQSLTQNDELKRLRVGPLIRTIIDNFDSNLKSEELEDGRGMKKMFMISGHDRTLTGLLDTLAIPKDPSKPRPIFASAILLELHRAAAAREPPEIRFLYKEGTAADAEEIVIPKCGNPCSYSKFVEILKPYKPTDWDFECKDLSTTMSTSHVLSNLLLLIAAIGSVTAVIFLGILLCRKYPRHYDRI